MLYNGPFPSCCLSRFRSESWCSTIVKEMSLICIRIRNSFPFEWLFSRTLFETEACSNSEMDYLGEVNGSDAFEENIYFILFFYFITILFATHDNRIHNGKHTTTTWNTAN